MTRTRDKLNEAKHYFQALRQTQAIRDEFIRAFSAFVSAARSVTYVMEDEFSRAAGFADWYRDKQAWMRTQPVLNFMNEMRVENLHRSDSRPTMRVTIPVGGQSVSIESELEVVHPSGVRELAEPERIITAPPGTVVRWILYREPFSERKPDSAAYEAISASEEWVTQLEALVDECERQVLDEPPNRLALIDYPGRHGPTSCRALFPAFYLVGRTVLFETLMR